MKSRANIRCVERILMNKHQIEEKVMLMNVAKLNVWGCFVEWLITELISVYHRIHHNKGFTVIISVIYHLIGVSSSGSEGGLCPPAHYCPEGSAGPVPCPAGTYTNLTGQSVCSRCPAGYYCAERTDNFTRFPCPPGFYCPDGRSKTLPVIFHKCIYWHMV